MSMRRGLVAVLLVAITVAVAWFAGPLIEPSYQGRSLHAWLKDLDGQHPGPKNDAAIEAVRHIGRDAVPEIISLLESRDSSLRQRFLKWFSDHHVVKLAYTPVLEDHHRAVLACNAIGPEAKPAIPALIALLNDGDYQRRYPGYVGAALGRIGPEAVVPLIGSLTNSDFKVRTEVATSLGHFRTSGPIVVPALIRCLQDSSTHVRAIAAYSLALIAQEPTTAVPALVGVLGDANLYVRRNACRALGEYKEQAQSATAPLFAALEDSDPTIRATAAISLARIESHNDATIEKLMPILIEQLQDIRGYTNEAIQALGECGSRGRPAEPALLECLKAAEPYTREAAAKSLKAIDPEAAAKAGVK
jgi:HEAT repeat protein